MIVSHRHKFIYIKSIKTASTSIETALSTVCGPDDIITVAAERFMKHRTGEVTAQNFKLDHPLVPKQKLLRRLLGRPIRYYHPEIGYYEHMPAWRVKAYLGDEIWNSYYKFSFERNPWDRQVSFYAFKTRQRDPRPTFDAFNQVKRRAYVENWDLYTIDGKPALDFLGTYEHLEDDFDRVLKRLGLEREVSLPSVNVSERERNYRDYYSAKTRALVESWYGPEIQHFGYSF